jgi:hypothetical protein
MRQDESRSINPVVQGSKLREKFSNVVDLVDSHFGKIQASPPCRRTMERALTLLGGEPASIVETGSSAWGVNSSVLWDSYVNSFGGSFHTVDIRSDPSKFLAKECSAKTLAHCEDSVTFLAKITCQTKVHLFYLDAFDLDPCNPLPSMVHGLAEFFKIHHALERDGGLLLIDDTPANLQSWISTQGDRYADELLDFYKKNGMFPGKGALVKQLVQKSGLGRILEHDYQLLLIF